MLEQFITLDILWAFERDWTEIMEFFEKFLIWMTEALRSRSKATTLVSYARRLYPQAGKYKLGLDSNGRMLRLKFSEAKRILREVLGVDTSDDIDVT